MRALAQRLPVCQGDFVYREEDPPVFAAARGVTLVDEEGRLYLDAEAANGSVGLGYDGDLLVEASRKAATMPALPSFLESSLRLRVASRLAERLEAATGARGRVAFDLGGAQGIELALKIARLNTRGARVVVFEGGYHGRSFFTSQISTSQRYRRPAGGQWLPVVRLPSPDCERCRFGVEPSTCAAPCAVFAEVSATSETAGLADDGGADVSAFVFEPLLNVGGMVSPDPRYLVRAAEAFRRRGALVVADEVFTGLHRTGPEWGFLRYQVTPDIVVGSKALGNGVAPITFVWAREALVEPERFPPGTHSVTFAGNPFALAVADSVLDRFDAWPAVEETVLRLESQLRTMLSRIAAESALVASASVTGATARLRLREPVAARVRAAARTAGVSRPVAGCHGLLVASTGMAPDVVALHPPLVFAPEHVDATGELLARALAAVEGRP